jgi:hypothetical protein
LQRSVGFELQTLLGQTEAKLGGDPPAATAH